MSSPLPPNANGADAAQIVFAGCENRTQMAGFLAATKVLNQLIAGGVGVVLGAGVVLLVARHVKKKKRAPST